MKKLLISTFALLTITAMVMAVPISYVQDDMTPVGEICEIQGVVTGITGSGAGGFFMQDAEAAWSGIQVYGDNTGIQLGMEVIVIGEKEEYYGWTELLITDVPTNVVILSMGNVVNPVVLTVFDAFQEPWEGVLVRLYCVTAISETSGYGEWEIQDATGDGVVDDMMLYPDMFYADLGEAYNVTGVMYYSYGAFKVEPRSMTEIILCGDLYEIEPTEYSLAANYPNPFNPTTTIDFDLAEPGMVSLTVFDISGHQVATLVDSDLSSGSHSVVFDASDLTSGLYFYMLRAGDFTATQKMILVK